MKFDALFATLSGYLAVFGVVERPQNPVERDYIIEHVRIPGGAENVTLDAELTLPRGSETVPGIVLITGSGPQDKNEELAGHKPFLVLSDHLTKSGYAVLRFDDRGTSKSTGNFMTATATDFAADAAAAMRFLKQHPRVNKGATGYLGHSEGGYVAPLAHQKVASDFQIFLAGPALPLLPDVMKTQVMDISLAEGGSAKDTAREIELVDGITEILKTSETPEDVHQRVTALFTEAGASKNTIKENANVWGTQWALDYMHHQPDRELMALDVPVLALFAEFDLQVAPDPNASEMRKLLKHPASEVEILPGMNHLFQPTKTGKISEYLTIKTTIDPIALNRMSNWLDTVTAQTSR